MTKPKILAFDIETAPAVAYVWKLWDENIGLDQLILPSRIICWAAKYVGEKTIYTGAEWSAESRPKMLSGLRELILDADAVLTYNGKKFDVPRIKGEFAQERLGGLPRLTHIDLIDTIKKMRLQSSKLAFAVEQLGIGSKMDTGGFRLWRELDCVDNKVQERARAKMTRYNIRDTVLLEKAYKLLQPYIDDHPYISPRVGCPVCGSHRSQSRGSRYTRTMVIRRRQCHKGHWFEGSRTRKPTE